MVPLSKQELKEHRNDVRAANRAEKKARRADEKLERSRERSAQRDEARRLGDSGGGRWWHRLSPRRLLRSPWKSPRRTTKVAPADDSVDGEAA